MKLSSRKLSRETKIELSMTSMIDVVFLLLIFFMTTASFVKTERNLDSNIKVNRPSAERSAPDLEPASIHIVQSGDRFVYKLGGRELTTHQQLQNVLSQFPNKSDGAFVHVSDDAPFFMPAAAIQAAKSAGFFTVNYIPAGK